MTSENQASEITDAAKAELRKTWENAAPGWAKWEHEFSAGLLDATDRLIEMAGIRPGMRVLDLACGAGSQTIQAAARVGAQGNVVACDARLSHSDYPTKMSAAEDRKRTRRDRRD